jgi:long-chain acyl-CoA synthetase
MQISSDLTRLNFRKIYYKNISFNKKTIDDAIESLSKYLTSGFFSNSPFVLLPAYNHIKTLIAFYSILRAGKIVVLFDPQCKSIELTEVIQDADPCALIYLNSSSISFRYEEEIVFRRSEKAFIISSDLKDVCLIAYTNAEDGYSKGAMLTEKNLLCEMAALIKTNGLNARSVTCALLPFSHLYGFVQGIMVPTHAGAEGLIVELNLLKIVEIVKEIKAFKVTHVYSVPALYYLMGKVPGVEEYIKGIHQFYSGGTKLSDFIYESFLQKTKINIREGYGLTESSPGVILNFEEDGPKKNSIGKPMPGSEIKIVNQEGDECGINEIGEIVIKGDMVFKGYFNDEKATKSILSNDWLHSGDYGKKDEEGYFYYCGLKKNMINVGGTNVYPRKMVRLMKMHQNVSEVEIYSEESLLQGQTVVARIKLFNSTKSSQEEFKKWCVVSINNSLLPKIWKFE